VSKPKSSSKAPTKPGKDAAAAADEIEIVATSLTKAQKAFLHRVSRFLVNIQSAAYSGRAARNGYTPAAHAKGWKLWSVASGMTRPLDHWFSEQQRSGDLTGIAGDRLRLLKDIDSFENTWFPRVRAVIRSVVPRDRRDAFAAAFFSNLEQQPLGPGVVGSVGGLLQRLDGLKTSVEPGAKQVFETLQERGLTAKKVAEVRALLKEAEAGAEKTPAKPAVTPEELQNAQTAQQDAYEALKDWWNEWSTFVRDAFNVREKLVLGLAIRRKRASGADEIVEEEEEIEEEEAGGEQGAEDEAEEAEAAEEEAAPAKAKSAPAKAKSGPAKGKGK
jgi:hypothetical protein